MFYIYHTLSAELVDRIEYIKQGDVKFIMFYE